MAQNQLDGQAMLRVGAVLRDIYRIDGYLASGGFGNTYLATNLAFKERVAIKEFFMTGVSHRNNDTTSISVSNSANATMFDKQLSTFKREAVRLRKLGESGNKHIVKVHDIFDENNTAYYVMQYINGKSLGDLLKSYGKPFDQVWLKDTILPQLLDALNVIHNENMWHLDIKPSNIMLDSKGNVVLIDFGSSKQIDPSSGDPITMSSTLSFTKTYAPLELQQYELKKIGPWSDFYSLGATLYNLATNQKPPTSSDILYEGARAFKFLPGTREDFKTLVMWMMNTRIEKRPQSVAHINQFLGSGHAQAQQEQVVVVSSSQQVPKPQQGGRVQPQPVANPQPVQPQVPQVPHPVTPTPVPAGFAQGPTGSEDTVFGGGGQPGLAPMAPAAAMGGIQAPSPAPRQRGSVSFGNNQPKAKKKTGWIIGGAVAAVALIGIILCLLMFNGGGNDYKAYIPADSKIVGKFDLKAFITQAGIDEEKLMKDVMSRIGDDFGDVRKSGMDLTSPIYVFARNNGPNFVFGILAKVENRKDLEAYLSKHEKFQLTKETSYSYNIDSDGALGVNDEVVAIVATDDDSTDALKADLDRVMNKAIDGDISDNYAFKKADGSNLFASLYADMELLPDEALDQMKRELELKAETVGLIKKMVIGLDGTVSGGVFDIKMNVSSSDTQVQNKINSALDAFGTISGQVGQSFAADDMMGVAFNADGAKLAQLINEILSQFDSKDLEDKTTKRVLDKFIGYISQMKGDITLSFKDEKNFMFKAEGQNFAPDMSSFIKQEAGGGVSTTSNGYSVAGQAWFGYESNKFYFTMNKDLAAQPSQLSGGAIPAPLVDVMKGSRILCFVNFGKAMELEPIDDKDAEAFKEIYDKIKYVTISFK